MGVVKYALHYWIFWDAYFLFHCRNPWLLYTDRSMTSWTGVSHFPITKTMNHRMTTTNREKQSNTDEKPLRFWRIPSMTAIRPNKYPQNAVIERQKNVPHDSIALAEIVPAPPRMRLIDVTTNSARNKIPPELPISLNKVKEGHTSICKINSCDGKNIVHSSYLADKTS